MGLNKYFYSIMIFILLFACFSTVNAVDINDTAQPIANDNLITDDSGFNSEVIGESSPGTFKDLSDEIGKVDVGGILNLTRDYSYSTDDSVIVIDKQITINGNGFKIDGGKSSQIFRCFGDEKVFNNITFCNGYSRSNGGAIYSESKLTLNDCIFEGNAVSNGNIGIAIYSTSDIFLKDSSFQNHYSKDYDQLPCLINVRSIYVDNSKFFKNVCGVISYTSNLNASNSQFWSNGGGSIYSQTADTANIKNCTFIGNSAFDSPDYQSFSVMRFNTFSKLTKVDVQDCKFINNTCYGTTILLQYTSAFFNNCEFVNNIGSDGSAINVDASKVIIKGSKFKSNSARGSGGAIYCSQSSQLTIDSSDFINNSADVSGGAIYWDCLSSRLTSCNFIGNSASEGGVISNFNLKNNTIERSSFSKNSANNGNIFSFSELFDSIGINYVISKISDNYYDNYEDMYAGAFSLKNNVLTVTKKIYTQQGHADISVSIDDKTFNGHIGSDGTCSIDLLGISSGVYNAKIIHSDGYHVSHELTMPLLIESFSFEVNDVVKTFGGPERLEINLKNTEGPLINENVDITINGVTYTRATDSNGHISMAINLNSGVYDAEVTYQNITKISKIIINQIETKTYLNVYKTSFNSLYMNVTVENANDGDEVIFKVTSPSDEREYKSILSNGKASAQASNLNFGYYAIHAIYPGNVNYKSSSSSYFFISISDLLPKVDASEVVKYYGGSERFIIYVHDGADPIYNASLKVRINGVDYIKTTDFNGIISMAINLNSGDYDVDCNYIGYYNVSSRIIVKPTISGNDVAGDYNKVKYSVNLKDSTGKDLTNGTLTFKINSKSFISPISDGKATIDIFETPGTYQIESINPVTGEFLSNKITVNPLSTKTELSGVHDISVKDSLNMRATVNASGGTVTFKVNSISKTVNLVNNVASCTIDDLSEGSYQVIATYNDGGGVYATSSDSKSLNVFKLSSSISVIADDIGEGQNAVFEITLNEDATGEVSVLINNKTYKNTLYNGKTLVSVPDLTAGNYTYIVSYGGDKYYKTVCVNGTIDVVKVNVILNASNLVKYYGSPGKLTAQLLDKSGNALSGQKIVFTINGDDYVRTTDNSGFASMNINLNSGNYTAGVKFDGNSAYDPIKTAVLIEIKPTVMAKDLSKIFRNATQYYATFVDSQGNLLKNTLVSFNINGVFYNRTTNDNGVARLNINLNPGEYILTAKNPSTGEFHTAMVTVLSSIVEANNLTKYYKNDSKYTLRILDDYGNPVGEGVVVKLNINGVFYERKTNSSGYINMNINLNPGTYIVTAEYNGLMASNTIEVLPILEAEDLSMKYKDGSKFEVKLLDGRGNPFMGQIITFNINGVFYDRVTGNDGIARLNINLMPGEYIITSKYSNGAALSNKITIRS